MPYLQVSQGGVLYRTCFHGGAVSYLLVHASLMNGALIISHTTIPLSTLSLIPVLELARLKTPLPVVDTNGSAGLRLEPVVAALQEPDGVRLSLIEWVSPGEVEAGVEAGVEVGVEEEEETQVETQAHVQA